MIKTKRNRLVKSPSKVYSTANDGVQALDNVLRKDEIKSLRDERIKAKIGVFKDDMMKLIISSNKHIHSLYIV